MEKKDFIEILKYMDEFIEILIGKMEGELDTDKKYYFSIEKVHDFLPKSGIAEARFIHALLNMEGSIVSDGDICRNLNIKPSSLKVYASRARVALETGGVSAKIIRIRGQGYRIADRDRVKSMMNLSRGRVD